MIYPIFRQLATLLGGTYSASILAAAESIKWPSKPSVSLRGMPSFRPKVRRPQPSLAGIAGSDCSRADFFDTVWCKDTFNPNDYDYAAVSAALTSAGIGPIGEALARVPGIGTVGTAVIAGAGILALFRTDYRVTHLPQLIGIQQEDRYE